MSNFERMDDLQGGIMLILDTATPYLGKKWYELAETHGLTVQYTNPTTQDEFMENFKSKKVRIVLNSYLVATRMGSYTPAMIEEIAKSGVRAVCHEGAGYESVGDIEEWKKYGVQVSCAPNSVALDTANTAIYLLLSAMRNFHALTSSLRRGNWTHDVALGLSPEGKTLGILGMGNIGQMTRDRARCLGFEKIQYLTRNRLPAEQERDSHYVPDLDEFLATSDVIVLTLPLNRHTYHLFDAKRLSQCKTGVVIVNIARGPIIDEAALVDALNSGKVASVGLDVYENEPEVHPELVANESITLLPHAGPRTQGTRIALEKELFANAKSFLETGKVLNLVPELR